MKNSNAIVHWMNGTHPHLSYTSIKVYEINVALNWLRYGQALSFESHAYFVLFVPWQVFKLADDLLFTCATINFHMCLCRVVTCGSVTLAFSWCTEFEFDLYMVLARTMT